MAIKEQWFKKAKDRGPIETVFYVDQDNLEVGFLEVGIGCNCCFRVTRSDIPLDMLELYFEQFAKLKCHYSQKFKL
ncbi:hypothetical protein BVG16_07690 [Paenibacillus selenitireducens]|uniref:Uncharacterized protein n=1 Tax=Paenibacillus selenitireducens TaxID=1324314 RepID=A0A1T2XL45_9BACL|nr:hypothetical protein [Paenibacillus selenitireducens]OPA80591.1 hypothetical protein BVG16_07690 [Paenibacillus selenitireducens]